MQQEKLLSFMHNPNALSQRHLEEGVVTERFLDDPNENSFAALFNIFAPQLISFFRARSGEATLAEDLTQEVMLTVYRKAIQLRDRALFRGWLFKIAQNTLRRHYAKQTREIETIDLAEVDNRIKTGCTYAAGSPIFEFYDWMALLDERERDVMTLRFVEQWEYHEIASARKTPIGTIQWRVFNSKKKLAGHLTARHALPRRVGKKAA